MSKKIFISRSLAEDSLLYTQLREVQQEIRAMSLIEFRGLPFGKVPACDWIFFYSKNAVRFFFDQLDDPAVEAKLAAIGPSTAAVIEARGQKPMFRGSGDPRPTAQAFIDVAGTGQVVLFPRAKRSRKSIQLLLKGKMVARDLIVYDNRPREDFQLPLCDILIFTSPLNARAYFRKYELRPDQQVVAIGPSTEKALRQLQINDVKMSASPSEAGIWDVVKSLL